MTEAGAVACDRIEQDQEEDGVDQSGREVDELHLRDMWSVSLPWTGVVWCTYISRIAVIEQGNHPRGD
jgi:hypothetical protein